MNKQQRQEFVHDFHRWVADEFLPEEEDIQKGSVEWEAHLNRLTTMVADFMFTCPEASAVERSDPLGFVFAYGDFVVRRLTGSSANTRATVEASGHRYYLWPFSMYFFSHYGVEMN